MAVGPRVVDSSADEGTLWWPAKRARVPLRKKFGEIKKIHPAKKRIRQIFGNTKKGKQEGRNKPSKTPK